MTDSEKTYDFFISYRTADEGWAIWIAWHLEKAGYSTLVQAWDFRPGQNFVNKMQRGATDCERTVAILTPNYFESGFTKAELYAAFAQDPIGEKGLLLPVRVEECDVEGLLGQIIYVNLVGLEQSEALERLLAGVKKTRAKPTNAPKYPGEKAADEVPPPVFPGLPAIWNVPSRNPHFTGRQEVLDGVRANLADGGAAALTQPAAIHGLGGVGKTQLAIE